MVVIVAGRLVESEMESNGSVMLLVVKDRSLAVSCISSTNSVGFRRRATALIYAVFTSRTYTISSSRLLFCFVETVCHFVLKFVKC